MKVKPLDGIRGTFTANDNATGAMTTLSDRCASRYKDAQCVGFKHHEARHSHVHASLYWDIITSDTPTRGRAKSAAARAVLG